MSEEVRAKAKTPIMTQREKELHAKLNALRRNSKEAFDDQVRQKECLRAELDKVQREVAQLRQELDSTRHAADAWRRALLVVTTELGSLLYSHATAARVKEASKRAPFNPPAGYDPDADPLEVFADWLVEKRKEK